MEENKIMTMVDVIVERKLRVAGITGCDVTLSGAEADVLVTAAVLLKALLAERGPSCTAHLRIKLPGGA